ncbi:ATPase [Cyanobium sp. Copco_Reservoir_LC18]|nr:ATPase [Cyanobium sp. Copco_Reservoir_LC18]
MLSELLQNADDAGAAKASARVNKGVFEFTHNGEDFNAEHFASLCRFGYSNKRSLHTIGFRGIGFKSTFSLGPVVTIQTPSLSVHFNKARFTLPCWADLNSNLGYGTHISVQIQDTHREAELGKNLSEWRQSPVSLLFFRTLRELTLNDERLAWLPLEDGPVPESQWYSLNGSDKYRYLLARSEPEDFPEDCIAEIKQERILGADVDFTLPPSRVELVLGASSGIYVVLPTSVRPSLPFACNGPFMQDPARVKIKDPETSPTNRWLLSRVGQLAASVMRGWLTNQDLDLAHRAEAYQLLLSRASVQQGIEGSCVNDVEESFFSSLAGLPIVLARTGTIEKKGQCISIDKQIRDIWPHDVFSRDIDPNQRKLLSEHISSETVDTLYRLGEIDRINRPQFCSILRSTNPPRPSPEKLLALWAYISGEFASIHSTANLEDISIVPIAGKGTLSSPRLSIRLGSTKATLSDEDNRLISNHIHVLDKEWTDYLESEDGDYSIYLGRFGSTSAKSAASGLLQKMGLADGSDTSKIIEKVMSSVHGGAPLKSDVVIRLAHICARLDCKIPKNFSYITQDGNLKNSANGVCHDANGLLKSLLPEHRYSTLVLSSQYGNTNHSCSPEEWAEWLSSYKSGLKRLPPLEKKEFTTRHGQALLTYIHDTYGMEFDPNLFPHRWERLYPYQRYRLIDYDFHDDIIDFWNELQSYDAALRALALEFLESSIIDWFSEPFIRIFQTNTGGSKEILVAGHSISASWLRRFQECNCIPDTRDTLCKPTELLRRSEETEPLIGIERFIKKRLDQSSNEKILELLGVSAALPGPHLLLSLLRTFSTLDRTPHSEVEKVFEQLDKLYQVSSSHDQTVIVNEFQESKLILTEQGEWSLPSEVFVSSDGLEAAGIKTVIASLQSLTLWRHIGIKERPSSENAVEFIESLEMGVELDNSTLLLAKIFLKRFAEKVISDCGAWLTLNGQLQPLKDFTYGLRSERIGENILFDSVRNSTADLRFFENLGVDVVLSLAGLIDLESAICYQLDSVSSSRQLLHPTPRWLEVFGTCLSRLCGQIENKQADYSELGKRLATTTISFMDELRLIPMVDGKPVGRPLQKPGTIVDTTIFVNRLPASRLANLIPVLIGEHLSSPTLQAAASYCYERSEHLIVDYFQSNFEMLPPANAEVEIGNQGSADDMAAGINSLKDSELTEQPHSKDSALSSVLWIKDADLSIKGGRDILAGEAQTELTSDDFSLDASGIIPDAKNAQQSHGSDPNADQTEPRSDTLKSAAVDDSTSSSQYSVVKAFAKTMDMEELQEGLFQSKTGVKLVRQRSEVFPWALISLHGDEIKRFLVRTLPIAASPLELDSIAFGMLDKLPGTHSLLLPEVDGSVGELSGGKVQSMINSGRIKVFPASYRLVMAL